MSSLVWQNRNQCSRQTYYRYPFRLGSLWIPGISEEGTLTEMATGFTRFLTL